jgi:hypothetical protein
MLITVQDPQSIGIRFISNAAVVTRAVAVDPSFQKNSAPTALAFFVPAPSPQLKPTAIW